MSHSRVSLHSEPSSPQEPRAGPRGRSLPGTPGGPVSRPQLLATRRAVVWGALTCSAGPRDRHCRVLPSGPGFEHPPREWRASPPRASRPLTQGQAHSRPRVQPPPSFQRGLKTPAFAAQRGRGLRAADVINVDMLLPYFPEIKAAETRPDPPASRWSRNPTPDPNQNFTISIKFSSKTLFGGNQVF